MLQSYSSQLLERARPSGARNATYVWVSLLSAADASRNGSDSTRNNEWEINTSRDAVYAVYRTHVALSATPGRQTDRHTSESCWLRTAWVGGSRMIHRLLIRSFTCTKLLTSTNDPLRQSGRMINCSRDVTRATRRPIRLRLRSPVHGMLTARMHALAYPLAPCPPSWQTKCPDVEKVNNVRRRQMLMISLFLRIFSVEILCWNFSHSVSQEFLFRQAEGWASLRRFLTFLFNCCWNHHLRLINDNVRA